MGVVLETEAGRIPLYRGKVRDIYDLGDHLVLVATDRISAFDWVLPTGIPDKGKILTALSLFWFRHLDVPNQVVSVDLAAMGEPFARRPEVFEGRSILVKKTKVVPIECVVRGYLAGSGWKEYRQNGTVCGQSLPPGLVEGDRLPSPIFTPATKANSGHDENITIDEMAQRVGATLTRELSALSLSIFDRATRHAESRGILIADTKFEFGQLPGGAILLIDEVLTPDSSRFWPASRYRPGRPQPSFDKQFVRDWLIEVGYDKESPPPPLPAMVVARTRRKYLEAYRKITGQPFRAR